MLIWFAVTLILCNLKVEAQNVTINTPMGTVTGFRVNYNNTGSNWFYGGGDIFLGIPFAQPPLGNLRFQGKNSEEITLYWSPRGFKTYRLSRNVSSYSFKMPQPLSNYPNGRLDATQYKAACSQPGAPPVQGFPPDPCSIQSEDCLYLNVFTPNATSANKYPVMVWIHGGSLTAGCAREYGYPGAVRNLVSRGVVVVVIQYRLGLTGFFTTNTPDFPPNRGLLDQLEALKWVQRNIASFGGDPRLVTLFGQSAGGMSVNAHTYSKLSRGLFQQAILESGVLYIDFDGPLGYQNLSAKRSQELCNISISSGNYGQLKSCMNALSPSTWLAIDQTNVGGWPMTRDNYFLPNHPQALNSQRSKIPVIYGNMRDESAALLTSVLDSGIPFDDFNKSYVQKWFGALEIAVPYGNNTNAVWSLLSNAYVPSGTSDTNSSAWWKIGCDIFTAASFTQYIVKEVKLQLVNGNPNVYVFEQTYASKAFQTATAEMVTQKLNGYRPVPHSEEVPFVWMDQPLWDALIKANRTIAFDFTLADAYGTWWTNFAKFGKPTLDNSWRSIPLSNTNQLQHYQIDMPQSGGMKMVIGYRDKDDQVFQNQLLSIFGQAPHQ